MSLRMLMRILVVGALLSGATLPLPAHAELRLIPELLVSQGGTDRSIYQGLDDPQPEAYAGVTPSLSLLLRRPRWQVAARGELSATRWFVSGNRVLGGGELFSQLRISERLHADLDYSGFAGNQIEIADVLGAPTDAEGQPRAPQEQAIRSAPRPQRMLLAHGLSLRLGYELDPRTAAELRISGFYRQEFSLDDPDAEILQDDVATLELGVARRGSSRSRWSLTWEAASYRHAQEDTTYSQGARVGHTRLLAEQLELALDLGLLVAVADVVSDPEAVPVGGATLTLRGQRVDGTVGVHRSVILDATLGGTSRLDELRLGLGVRFTPHVELALGLAGVYVTTLARTGPDDTEGEEDAVRTDGSLYYLVEGNLGWALDPRVQLALHFERYFVLGLMGYDPELEAAYDGDVAELRLRVRWE